MEVCDISVGKLEGGMKAIVHNPPGGIIEPHEPLKQELLHHCPRYLSLSVPVVTGATVETSRMD